MNLLLKSVQANLSSQLEILNPSQTNTLVLINATTLVSLKLTSSNFPSWRAQFYDYGILMSHIRPCQIQNISNGKGKTTYSRSCLLLFQRLYIVPFIPYAIKTMGEWSCFNRFYANNSSSCMLSLGWAIQNHQRIESCWSIHANLKNCGY